VDIKDVEMLVKLLEGSSLTELKVRDKDFSVTLVRSNTSALARPTAVPGAVKVVGGEEKEITAPMVGTFYSAPTPKGEPFVAVGDTVDVDSIVCVLEAMKVFTEVPANLNGTITEVLVADGEFVEFGQPLFRIKIS
jgi:acetyl-CoA carboxylase biotin carboxyl carrier protein